MAIYQGEYTPNFNTTGKIHAFAKEKLSNNTRTIILFIGEQIYYVIYTKTDTQ